MFVTAILLVQLIALIWLLSVAKIMHWDNAFLTQGLHQLRFTTSVMAAD